MKTSVISRVIEEAKRGALYVPRVVYARAGGTALGPPPSDHRRWVYLSVFGRQPFKRFDHGGWLYLNASWIRRFWSGA